MPTILEGMPREGVKLTGFGVKFTKYCIAVYRASKTNDDTCPFARLDYLYTYCFSSRIFKEKEKNNNISIVDSGKRATSGVHKDCQISENGTTVEFIKDFLQESHSFDNPQNVIGPFKYGEKVNLQPKDAAFFIKNGYAEACFSETNRATSEVKKGRANPTGGSL